MSRPVAGPELRPDADRRFRSALVAELPALRRYATALVGSVSWADDLVQDTIERALRGADTLEDMNRLGAWLRSILHNVYLSELRRRRPVVSIDLTDLNDTLSYSTAQVDRNAINEFVRAIASLSIEHRQVLLLVGVEGLSYREVAQELGVPIGTVMSRLARARERLRSALEHGGPQSQDAPVVNFAASWARKGKP